MSANECTIRDNLAKQLGILERGLELVATEYPLPNPYGSKGYIDILAKDGFGNRVIVELKRSNQSARQAIHEIFKYAALLRSKEGLLYGKLRCLIVSTEWHELAVPFAEFLRVADCQCDGFAISVDHEGAVISAEKQQPVHLAEPIKLFQEHAIFLFKTHQTRDSAIDNISNAFVAAGGLGSFLMIVDYRGDSTMVIYKYVIYLAPTCISDATISAIKNELIEEYGSEFDAQELRRSVEEHFQGLILETADNVWDSYEIGNPEKFVTILEMGWAVDRIIRIGSTPTEASYTDDEVKQLVAGTEGQNTVQFCSFSSPRLNIQWKEVKENAEYCLKGNDSWLNGFNWFHSLIQSEYNSANVGIAIYNPLNLPVGLFKILERNDTRFLPSFEIVTIDSESNSLISLLGQIEWDGTTQPSSVSEVFTPGIGGLEMFFLRSNLGGAWELDTELMSRHGLYYALTRVDENNNSFDSAPIAVTSGQSYECQKRASSGKTIDEFVEANIDYLREFVVKMNSCHFGL